MRRTSGCGTTHAHTHNPRPRGVLVRLLVCRCPGGTSVQMPWRPQHNQRHVGDERARGACITTFVHLAGGGSRWRPSSRAVGSCGGWRGSQGSRRQRNPCMSACESREGTAGKATAGEHTCHVAPPAVAVVFGWWVVGGWTTTHATLVSHSPRVSRGRSPNPDLKCANCTLYSGTGPGFCKSVRMCFSKGSTTARLDTCTVDSALSLRWSYKVSFRSLVNGRSWIGRALVRCTSSARVSRD